MFYNLGVTTRVGLSLLAPSYVGELKHTVQSLTQIKVHLKCIAFIYEIPAFSGINQLNKSSSPASGFGFPAASPSLPDGLLASAL